MAEADDIKQGIIDDAAAGISKTVVDGVETDAMSIDERIKAAKFAKADEAASQPGRGLRFTQLVPPGCI